MGVNKNSRYALVFIFVTVLLDSIGFGIILPVMPKLIMSITGEPLAAAARYGGWLLFVYAFMQFLAAPVMGNLSDRFGRRPVLLISLLAFGLDYFLMSWAPTIHWLFVGRWIAGVSASTFGTANAYIADISPPEKRAQNFGLVGAAFGGGFILGPVIGGLLGTYGPRVPFIAAGCLTLLNFLWGLLVLPETLDRQHRRPFELKRANPVGALAQLFKYPVVFGLAITVFLYQMGHFSLPATWSYYTIEKFSWTETEIGYSLGFVGVLMAFIQGYLTRVVIPKLGPERSAFIGFAAAIVSFVGYAVVTAGWALFPFLVVAAFSGFVSPSVQGIMSNRIPANAQGELQGAIGSVGSLTAILSPPLMAQLFGYFSAVQGAIYFPGAAFIAAALLTLMSMAVFARVITKQAPAPAVTQSDSQSAEVAGGG